MRTRWIPLLVCGLLALIPVSAWAHHGREFLVIATPELPHHGQTFVVLSSEITRQEGHHGAPKAHHTAIEWEPGVFYGLTDYWSAELHTHLERDEGTAVRYASTAVEHRLNLNHFFPRLPMNTGLLVEYEHGYGEHASRSEGRVLVTKGVADLLIAVNLGVEHIWSTETAMHYGIGFRHQFTRRISAGVEYLGQLTPDFQAQLIPGFYVNVGGRMHVQLGGTIGISDPTRTTGVRTTLIIGL